MSAFIKYIKQRYSSKLNGFGKPLVPILWLDAVIFGLRKWYTLNSIKFHRWCGEVDFLFHKTYDWKNSYTTDTGRGSYLDAYWQGLTPIEVMLEEVSYWDAEV